MREEIIDMETQNEVGGNTIGVGTYKLKKPTLIDGVQVKELNYNLEALDGKAIRNIRTTLGRRGYIVSAKEIDSVLHAAMFAEACGLTIDNIEALSATDYMNVADIVRDFLIGEE